jgi:hypothetical protein
LRTTGRGPGAVGSGLLLAALALFAALAGPAAAGEAGGRPLAGGSLVQDKNFYLLTALEADAQTKSALAADPALSAALQSRMARIREADASCQGNVACLLAPFIWTDLEAQEAGDRLLAVLQASGRLQALAKERLRPTGRFERDAGMDDAALVRQAFLDAVAGLNHILRVWGAGEAPLYPLIDSISYAPGDKMWSDGVKDMVEVMLDPRAPPQRLVFEPSLEAALDVLAMNDRDEPARLEPLEKGENAAALAYARTLHWADFPYPAMIIPGRSPTLKDNPLSPEGRMKLRLAARRFQQGLAPLIITTGGYVSPAQTRFCEALEMKRELMRTYGVPERAILIDPFARHTTTNLRNAYRLLVEAGAPAERPVLVTTTDFQSRYIEAKAFQDRCVRELGYPCYAGLKRLSPFDTSLTLPRLSLHRDARDPLDP